MKAHFKSVVYISLVFLFYQAVVNTGIGILSQFTHQNGNDWVGPYANALLFVGTAVGVLYNSYIDKYPYKIILCLSSLSFLGYIGLTLLFLKIGFSNSVEFIILGFSLVIGLVLSVLYNGQYNYINVCSKIDRQTEKYFGWNLAIVQSANILGNTLSAILITPLGQFMYSVVMEITIFCICLFFLLVKEVRYPHNQEKDVDNQIQDNLSQSEQRKQSILSSQHQQPLQNENNAVQTLDSPYWQMPTYFLSGVVLSMVYVQLSIVMYQMFPDMDSIKLNRLTFIVFVFEGVGQFTGGLFVALFSRHFKSIPKLCLLMGNLFLISIVIVYIGKELKNSIVIAIGAFVLGISDSSIFSLGLSMAGKWEKKGLTLFNFTQCSSFALSVIIFYYAQFQIFLVYAVSIHILAVASTLKEIAK